MRKIVSFCVYGLGDIYNYGVYENAMLMPIIYPGWLMVVYYTKTCNQKVIEELRKLKYVELQFYDLPDSNRNTMLRFIAGFELKNDIVIFRDADSRINLREKCAVEDWLKSKKNVHMMRDYRLNRSTMMAGMWGVRNKIIAKPNIILDFWKYFNDPKNKLWMVDQKYLAKYVHPIIKNDILEHSDFPELNKNCVPFPKYAPPRKENFFVGQTIHYLPYSVKKFGINDKKYEKSRAGDGGKKVRKEVVDKKSNYFWFEAFF